MKNIVKRVKKNSIILNTILFAISCYFVVLGMVFGRLVGSPGCFGVKKEYTNTIKTSYFDSGYQVIYNVFPDIEETSLKEDCKINEFRHIFCKETASQISYKDFFIYLDVTYSETEYQKETNRLENCQEGNLELKYDNTKKLFNYDVYVAWYPCIAVYSTYITSGDNERYSFKDAKHEVCYWNEEEKTHKNHVCYMDYLYVLLDSEIRNIKYVYLNYLDDYGKEIPLEKDLYPINYENNKSFETYDGYFYSCEKDKSYKNNNYWHTDEE